MEDDRDTESRNDPLKAIGTSSTEVKDFLLNKYGKIGTYQMEALPAYHSFFRISQMYGLIGSDVNNPEYKKHWDAISGFFDQDKEVLRILLSSSNIRQKELGLRYLHLYTCIDPKWENAESIRRVGLEQAADNLELISQNLLETDKTGNSRPNYIALGILESLALYGSDDSPIKAVNYLEGILTKDLGAWVDFGLVNRILDRVEKPPLSNHLKWLFDKVFEKYKLNRKQIFDNVYSYLDALFSDFSIYELRANLTKNISVIARLEEQNPGIASYIYNIRGLHHIDDSENLRFKDLVFEYQDYKNNPKQFTELLEEDRENKKDVARKRLISYGLDPDKVYALYTSRSLKYLAGKLLELFTSDDINEALLSLDMEAIDQLEQVVPGICKKLSEEFDIRFFGRYPPEVLLEQYDYELREEFSKPFGVILFPESDWNGSFYNKENVLRSFSSQLSTGGYTLKVIEAASKLEAVRLINKIRKKYGKIAFALVGGHGEKGSVQLGNSEHGTIKVEDFLKQGAGSLSSAFQENPTIILSSCSTGMEGGIAEHMAMGATVIAPNSDTFIESISIKYNKQGRPVFDVIYNKAKNMEYRNHTLVSPIDKN